MSKSRKTENSSPKKVERTGAKTFNVHHDDGSVFECTADSKARLDAIDSKLGCGKKIFQFGGIGDRKPLYCDNCKERVYKISSKNGKSLCDRCS